MALHLDDRQRAMLQEMGVHVWLPSLPAATPAPTAEVRVAPQERPAPKVQAPQSTHVLHADWPTLAAAVAQCQACGLCAGRKHATLQALEAPAQADWFILGDPPDEDEDHAGAPFVQETGALLDNMLRALELQRSQAGVPAARSAYVTNVVKCRPPVGTIPQAADLAQCATYLQREIALVQPKIILAMGRFATQLVLSGQPTLAGLPLGKLRGTVYSYQGIPVVLTYHPKLLLRTSADKAKAWSDLCLARATVSRLPTIAT